MTATMKLGAFLRPPGHHVAAWRHPDSAADAGVNIQHYVQLAQTAERGLFDLIFMADTVTVFEAEPDVLSHTSYVVWFEPFSLMSALSMATRHIGLVCTATTTYDEPFHIGAAPRASRMGAASSRSLDDRSRSSDVKPASRRLQGRYTPHASHPALPAAAAITGRASVLSTIPASHHNIHRTAVWCRAPLYSPLSCISTYCDCNRGRSVS